MTYVRGVAHRGPRYTRGADGLYRAAAGQTINLEVCSSGGDDTHEAGTFSVADELRRIGIASNPFLIPQSEPSDLAFNQNFPGLRLWRQPNDLYQLRLGRVLNSVPVRDPLRQVNESIVAETRSRGASCRRSTLQQKLK